MSQYDFFAPCPLNFEEQLYAELSRLKVNDPLKGDSGVSFSGDLETVYTVCLHSRLASRLLLKCGEFTINGPDELYQAAQAVSWSDHFSPEETLSIRATGWAKGLENSRFTALKTKDAVVDQFRDSYGKRPDVSTDNPDIRLEVRLQDDKVLFYIDISGSGLSRRGYREKTTAAPIRENTAAGLLYLAGWPEIAAAGGSFVDPFCGSGTLLIEAAFMAAGTPANILRGRFGFEKWKQHDRKLWKNIRMAALEQFKAAKENLPPIFGFDKDQVALNAAAANISKAGLEGSITLKHQELKDISAELLPAGTGLLCMNPPYGKRLEETADLEPLYRQIGFASRKLFPGWTTAFVTSDRNLIYATGLKTEQTENTMNGDIKVFLTRFAKDQEPPLSRLSESGRQFLNRLKKNRKERRKQAKKENVGSYRLYDADLPDYNAAIDLYENRWAVISEYAPPVRIDLKKAERRIREIQTVLSYELDLRPQEIFFKKRQRQKGAEQYRASADAGSVTTIIKEGDCLFRVNFTDYIDTGIFLDHRPLRQRIGDESRDRSFLNLFAYTGTASVHAAKGGATRTVTVDASQTYLDWAKENFRLNTIDGDHSFIRSDVFEYLKDCRDSFDIIMLDPPTFSNSKSRPDIFDVQRDHKGLLDLCWKRLADGGVLYFSNNYRKFNMEWSIPEKGDCQDITPETIPFDFARNQKIHSCWRITKREKKVLTVPL